MSLLDGFRRKRKDEPETAVEAAPEPAPALEQASHSQPQAHVDHGEPHAHVDPHARPEQPPVAAPLPPEIPAPAATASDTAEASAAAGESTGDRDHQDIHDDVVGILKTVYDPEIPVDIYELGLIYEVDVRQGNVVYVQMTLTSPMCPVAESLPIEVEAKVRTVADVADVELDLVWEPPWSMDMMSEAAKLELNML